MSIAGSTPGSVIGSPSVSKPKEERAMEYGYYADARAFDAPLGCAMNR